MIGPGRRVALAALLAACGACLPVGRGRPSAVPPAPVAGILETRDLETRDLETRGLLLRLVDTQRFEPVVLAAAMRGGADLREAAAEAMGRIGDPRTRSYLAELTADPVPAVRRAAAFALGELDLPPPAPPAEAAASPSRGRAPDDRTEAARALLVAAVDPDREVGILAVEALGKLGVSVVDVLAALTAAELGEPERWARLLPALFRFDEEATVAVAAGGLAAAGDPELRRAAAYALARTPRPAALPALRTLGLDPDPRIRGWAARALGLVGEPAEDLPLLAGLLDSADPAPIVQSLRAGGVLRLASMRGEGGEPVSSPDPATVERWRRRVAQLLADPRPHVRLAALEAAAPWLPDPTIEARLAARAAGEPPATTAGERGAALVALADGRSRVVGGSGTPGTLPGESAVVELVAAAAASDQPLLRTAAARAAARVGAGSQVLARLLADPSPAVRAAAHSAVLGDDPGAAVPAPPPRAATATATATAAALAASTLADEADPGVLGVVLGWLADHPVVAYEELTKVVQRLVRGGGGDVETALAAIRALAARGTAEPRERGGVVAVLERLAASGDWLVRRAAARELAGLGRPAPAVEPPRGRPMAVYEEIVERTRAPRTVEVVTSAGTFVVELACPRAPMTCLSFLHLAGQSFYDGLTFHRVVPDFVVQGGDPRGDGSGGPPFTLRDEITRLGYERGTVGMALAGPDTGGSQFFVTLAPQPHLDGGYTAFGRVVAGDEVLDGIVPGTVIERIRETAPRAGPDPG